MNKIKKLLKKIPYYWKHAIVAVLLYGVFAFIFQSSAAGACAGSFFYVGREQSDWEGSKGEKRVSQGKPRMDWEGLLYPIGVCLAIYLISLLF